MACNCGRVVAKKCPQKGVKNIFQKLQMREICPKRGRSFNLKWEPQRFRNFQLQEEYDTSHPMFLMPPEVDYITSARGVVFVLFETGTCYAYKQDTQEKLCMLNDSVDRGIQTLFYHKGNDTVLTVSVSSLDNSIEFRTTSIMYIRRGRPDLGFRILESEQLKSPGYIRFDDVNQKIITSFPEDGVDNVKVFDLKNYAALYSFRVVNLLNLKIGPGIMLLRFAKSRGYVHLKILSIEDGAEHKSFDFRLDRDKEPKLIELFDEKLLIKQKLKNLQILNLRNAKLTEISGTEYNSSSRTIFLNQNRIFLTRRKNFLVGWDLQEDDLVTTPFGDHILWLSDDYDFYITRDQDIILSYCICNSNYQRLLEGKASSINISHTVTGRSIAKIHATSWISSDPDFNKKMDQSSRISTKVEDALEGITAVYFDEEQNRIYTGNSSGVHVWYN